AVVLLISALGTLFALAGIILGIIQLRHSPAFPPFPPFPLTGLFRVLFSVFTFTWVLSGMLSMQPLDWASGGNTGDGIPEALSGGAINLSAFPAIDAGAWKQVLGQRAPKEIAFLRIQGDPYYLVSGVEDKP